MPIDGVDASCDVARPLATNGDDRAEDALARLTDADARRHRADLGDVANVTLLERGVREGADRYGHGLEILGTAPGGDDDVPPAPPSPTTTPSDRRCRRMLQEADRSPAPPPARPSPAPPPAPPRSIRSPPADKYHEARIAIAISSLHMAVFVPRSSDASSGSSEGLRT